MLGQRLGQFQTLRQGLVLTPALQQSIRLLQLSTLELEQEIEQVLLTNPFLEREAEPEQEFQTSEHLQTHNSATEEQDAQSNDDTEPTIDEPNWEGDGTHELDIDSSDWGVEDSSRGRSNGESPQDIEDSAIHTDLVTHLKQQLLHLRLNPTELACTHYLIDNLDERGFLTEPLSELATGLAQGADTQDEVLDQLRIALAFIQSLEPRGVGALDRVDSLRVQIKQAHAKAEIDARQKQLGLLLLAQPLQDLLPRHAKRLAKELHLSLSQVEKGLALIAKLNPSPASAFERVQNSAAQADVFVRQKSGKRGEPAHYVAELNLDIIPRLKLDTVTLGLLQLERERRKKTHSNSDSNDLQNLQACALDARVFIKSITQRFDTILRVAQAIVQRQQAFFVLGVQAMKPLTLHEIADELDLHESTVSRVISSKYMLTPRGMLAFKYFFDAGLSTAMGVDTSGTAVRAKITEWIASENKARPLSDSQIADKLARLGIQCARRTVAKYREALRIPAVSLRRI